MSAALEGLRVLDFGQGIAGPYAAQMLGDHGADVLKIEPPRGDWSRTMGAQSQARASGSFLSVNRNKRGLCLNLAQPAAVAIARQLAERADVLVESFRPGVMERLGLGEAALRDKNPGLVYCAVTGFGADGPNAALPASDSIIQGWGGLMSINGARDGEPLRMGNVVADMLAGMNAFAGVLLALRERDAGGPGRRVTISLLDSLVAFQAPPLTEYLLTGAVPRRMGNDHPLTSPAGAFRASDGLISLAVMDHKWLDFCAAVDIGALAADPRFATGAARQAHRDALRAELDPLFARHDSAHWLRVLRAADVLCGPIHDYASLREDPQVRHNRLLALDAHGGAPVVRSAVRVQGTPESYAPAPMLGEHTRAVLAAELGLDTAAIDRLVADGAVRTA
jgi:crotonobetainyl-CoA:carnitine CoA-transferase CaiB-like acyl-CoA transferase